MSFSTRRNDIARVNAIVGAACALLCAISVAGGAIIIDLIK